MGKERTQYDLSFKENVVKFNCERKNASELARELCIPRKFLSQPERD